MSEVKPQLVWLPDGFGGGEHVHVYRASDYDALTGRYECNTAIMRARTKALDRVTAERDAALAELAALKGGQVQLDTLANLLPELDDALEDLEMHGRHSDQGYRKLKDWYRKMEAVTDRIAPPAQASAWVPEGLTAINRSMGRAIVRFKTTDQLNAFYRSMKAELPAAPTTGASDGKGGEK